MYYSIGLGPRWRSGGVEGRRIFEMHILLLVFGGNYCNANDIPLLPPTRLQTWYGICDIPIIIETL